MQKLAATILVIAVIGAASVAKGSEEVSVELMPPVVVRTIPESGATDVNPSLSEIKVTFSKKMMDKSWSWVRMSVETFPELVGKPYYLEDKKTCAVKVKLEPGKAYVVWFNSERFMNFKDLGGRSAIPYLLAFETSN